MAEGITMNGQLVIQYVANKLNAYLNSQLKTTDYDFVVYVDTDSNYITLAPFVEKYRHGKPMAEKYEIVKKLEPLLQKVIADALNEIATKLNCPIPCMKMARENIMNRALWTSKKKYVLNIIDDGDPRLDKPKQKVMGLELKKSSTPKGVKPILTKVIDCALNHDEAEVQKLLIQYRDEYDNLPLVEIASVTGVSQINKWVEEDGSLKNGTPHGARSAYNYNKLLKEHGIEDKYYPIREGDKVKQVFLRMPNPASVEKLAFMRTIPEEFGLEKYIDRDTMWDKTVISPTKIILTAIGWTPRQVNSFDI